MGIEKNDTQTNEELQGQLKRALADYANLKNRFEKEKKEIVQFSNEVLLAKLVNTLDGFEMIMKEFTSILSEYGFEKKEISKGVSYDPEIMEAVEMEDGGDVVTEVYSQAYSLHGKTVRPARVKIGKQ